MRFLTLFDVLAILIIVISTHDIQVLKRGDDMLTERQLMILKEIIRLFTESGQPVGSKKLMAELPVHVSSATIRNDMADLESVGLIEKTHSSSGRVPSMQGYRYYLDHLMQPATLNPVDVATVQQSFGQHYHKIDEIVSQSANILSNLTSYTAITLGPEVAEIRLTGFRLVPLSNHQVMAIIVTSAGTVDNQVFTIPQAISGDKLEKAIRIINDHLIGLPLTVVSQKLKTDVPALLAQYMASPTGFLDIFDDVLKKASQERLFVGGQMNLLNFSEFSDVTQLKSLYNMINRSDDLAKLLDLSPGGANSQVQVRLGTEMANDLLKHYSLMTVNYDVGEHGQGVIALLGPTSMPYSRMIGLLDLFREELAKKLIDYYANFDDDQS